MGWVLIGDRPYTSAEVTEATGIAVVAVLPDDPRSAVALQTGGGTGRLRRSPLVRAATALAVDLANRTQRAAAAIATSAPNSASEPRMAEAVR